MWPDFHDPPSSGYLGPLAKELSSLGVPACAVGQGISAAVIFEDPRLALEFGSIVLSRPVSGRVRFIRQSGEDIAAISDIHAAAEIIREAVCPDGGSPQDGDTAN